MSRGIIFGVGLFALTLLAFLCIPRHLPVTSSATGRSAFSAHIENGQLTLSGTVASEEAKGAAVARAQDLAKSLRLRVTDNLNIIEDGQAAGSSNHGRATGPRPTPPRGPLVRGEMGAGLHAREKPAHRLPQVDVT